MNHCRRCNAATHLDFPTGVEKCNGCDRRPLFCGCEPVQAMPVWLQRARDGQGVAKDYTRAAA